MTPTLAPMSIALALFIGFMLMPALNVIRVDARGLGHERFTPARAKISAALDFADRLRLRVLYWRRRHPALGMLAAGLAMLLLTVIKPTMLAAAPIMGALSEGQRAGEFLLEERLEAGRPSRENVTVLSGQNLVAGAVVGRVTKGIGRAASAYAGTGNGTMTGLFASPEVEVGAYVVKCIAAAANSGTFAVTTPSGKALPNATVAVAYVSRHLNFTINDGAADFIVNDQFTVTVSTTAPVVSGSGNGTISAISLGPDAKVGRYKLTCSAAAANAGTFSVVAPDGDRLGDASVGVAYVSRQVNFTLNDGATDYIVGDAFELVVYSQLNGGKVVAWDPTNYDGRHVALGALFDAIDASAADKAGVIVTRDAAFRRSELQWGAAISASEKVSAENDLLRRGIVLR